MTFYYCFKNAFPVDGVRPYMNLPPITIDDIPLPPKHTDTPLIHFQLPFMLPQENLLIYLPPLLIPQKFLSCILMILKLNTPP